AKGRLPDPVPRHARAIYESFHLVAGGARQNACSVFVNVFCYQGRRKDAQALSSNRSTVIGEVRARCQSLHRIDIATIGFLEANALGKIVEVTADHVVAPGDFMAGADERVRQMTAEKPGGAGNENLHRMCPDR